MKKILFAIGITLAAAALALGMQQARAEQVQTLGFSGCPDSGSIPGDIAIGEAQLLVQIWPVGGDQLTATQIGFAFHNIGPQASSITDVYFADGVLIDNPQITDSDQGSGGDPGVDFSEGASPQYPSGGGNCTPPWPSTTQFLAADSDPAVQPNGVNPGEWLGVVFDLINNNKYQDVINQLTSGQLRVAFRVQGYASGGSETFSNTPPTAITLVSFQGAARRGQVTLRWTTGTEIDNAGFNLYRASTPAETRMRVNPMLLAASGDPVSGASYSYSDSPGYGVHFYWLEDIGSAGISTIHGPLRVSVRPAFRRPLHRPAFPRHW